MNPVVHFEIPSSNNQEMCDFYSTVFGWQTEQYGEEMGNYVVVKTTESDEQTSRPKEPGSINGGLYQKDPSNPDHQPTVVIAVDDIKEHMEKITAAGCEIVNGPDDIPGVGIYASFRDPSGNRISILQPSGM